MGEKTFAMQLYSNETLSALREQQDPLADKAIASLYKSKRGTQFREMIAQLNFNAQEPPKNTLADLDRLFTTTNQLPSWADPYQLKIATRFFKKNVVQIMSLLGTLSLPYCYAAADGAQVLFLSERIKKDTNNRLLETALFIFDLFDSNALKPDGRALRSIQKVRLIHAAIRYHVNRYPDWNSEWGKPVNQEDMLGTNLAFSLIILRGLKKIGCAVSLKESEAWLHAWRVYGSLMGVDDSLLPKNMKEAFLLEKAIRKRNFKASKEGQSLTQSLIKHYSTLPEVAKFPKGYMPSYMRFVLGNEVADMLNVPKSDWSGIFVQQFRILNVLGISPNQEPLTRDLLIKQLSYEPSFAAPEKLGV